jgi:hypothetical protein
MEEGQENEKLIGKLIKKRKQENEAFMKLLHAIETMGIASSTKAPIVKKKRKQENEAFMKMLQAIETMGPAPTSELPKAKQKNRTKNKTK